MQADDRLDTEPDEGPGLGDVPVLGRERWDALLGRAFRAPETNLDHLIPAEVPDVASQPAVAGDVVHDGDEPSGWDDLDDNAGSVPPNGEIDPPDPVDDLRAEHDHP